MRSKKIVFILMTLAITVSQIVTQVCANENSEALQVYFSDAGKIMNIFTSEDLDDDVSVLIGNETIDADVQSSDIEINTTFLIDNSNSISKKHRDKIKDAVKDYVSSMPKTEKVKIAKFDEKTTILADEYSNDSEFIDYELSKIDFKGESSIVYDALMNSVKSMETDNDIYYRTVLITDGVDSVEGTSFEYLRSEISENGRYHIDVIQVSRGKQKEVNLKAIGDLGSNTYNIFTEKDEEINFDFLKQDKISLVKVGLVNEVTTGELKGVTIKSGTKSIPIGSILFPQVEIVSNNSTQNTHAIYANNNSTTKSVTRISASSENKKNQIIMIVIIAVAGAAVLGIVLIIIIVIVVSKKKKKKSAIPAAKCRIAVEIIKDDPRDHEGVGKTVWEFPINSEFRVGRTLKPASNGKEILPENHAAICERAVDEDISSIGRNAFSLRYEANTSTVIIKNIAKNAKFSINDNGRTYELIGGQTHVLTKGANILLGGYTTVIVNDISKENGRM